MYGPTKCTVSDNLNRLAIIGEPYIVSSNPKVPVERRRRVGLLQGVLRISKGNNQTPLRRESDQVRARLQRWIELADRALGRHSDDDHDHPDSSAA